MFTHSYTAQRQAVGFPAATDADDSAQTWLHLDEHAWLHGLLQGDADPLPTLGMPDLISACVTQLFAREVPAATLFRQLAGKMTSRRTSMARWREAVWRSQYRQLQALQRSYANRCPHPRFRLDQITAGCVALARSEDASGERTSRHARSNLARRSGLSEPPS